MNLKAIVQVIVYLVFTLNTFAQNLQDFDIKIASIDDSIKKEYATFQIKKTSLSASLNDLNSNISLIKDSIFILNKELKSIDGQIQGYASNIFKETLYKNLIVNQWLNTNLKENQKAIGKITKKLRKDNAIPESFKILLLLTNSYRAEISAITFDKTQKTEGIQLNLDSKNINKLINNSKLSWSKFDDSTLFELVGLNQNYFTKLLDQSNLNELIKFKNNQLNEIEIKKLSIVRNILLQEKNHKEILTRLETTKQQTKQQILDEKQYDIVSNINYKKYKTIKINGIEIVNSPLIAKEFNNGEKLMWARTPIEWDNFIKNEIPAYKYIDYDENNISRGLIYNSLVIDKKSIIPIGFHALNILDLNYLKIDWGDGDFLFQKNKIVNCGHCENGKSIELVLCKRCYGWSEDQRKYNVCNVCNNQWFLSTRLETCIMCKGTGKNTITGYAGIYGVDLNSSSNAQSFGALEIDDDGQLREIYEINYEGLITGEFSQQVSSSNIILVKNRSVQSLIKNSTTIGDLEIMNGCLDITKFNNGDPIQYIEDSSMWEFAIMKGIPAYCYYNNKNDSLGCIYNTHAINDKRGIIPKGWRFLNTFDLKHLYLTIFSESSGLPLRTNGKASFNTYIYVSEFLSNSIYLPLFGITETRNKEGVFEQNKTWGRLFESNAYIPKGKIICVRDAAKSNFNLTPSKYRENLVNYIQKTEN